MGRPAALGTRKSHLLLSFSAAAGHLGFNGTMGDAVRAGGPESGNIARRLKPAMLRRAMFRSRFAFLLVPSWLDGMRVRITIRLIACAGLLVVSDFVLAAEPTRQLTLGQALARTLKENPELAAFS